MSVSAAIALPIAYGVVQALALHRMRDGWRLMALAPVPLFMLAFVAMAAGIAANVAIAMLAPILALPVATAFLTALLVAHRIATAMRPLRRPRVSMSAIQDGPSASGPAATAAGAATTPAA